MAGKIACTVCNYMEEEDPMTNYKDIFCPGCNSEKSMIRIGSSTNKTKVDKRSTQNFYYVASNSKKEWNDLNHSRDGTVAAKSTIEAEHKLKKKFKSVLVVGRGK